MIFYNFACLILNLKLLSRRTVSDKTIFLLRYVQKRYQHRSNLKEEDEESDLESVQSEEFEEMLNNMAGLDNEKEELDYMGEIGDSLKKVEGSKKKRGKSDDDDDDDDEEEEEEDGLDDEELPFSDDEEEGGLEATEEDLGLKT